MNARAYKLLIELLTGEAVLMIAACSAIAAVIAFVIRLIPFTISTQMVNRDRVYGYACLYVRASKQTEIPLILNKEGHCVHVCV